MLSPIDIVFHLFIIFEIVLGYFTTLPGSWVGGNENKSRLILSLAIFPTDQVLFLFKLFQTDYYLIIVSDNGNIHTYNYISDLKRHIIIFNEKWYIPSCGQLGYL